MQARKSQCIRTLLCRDNDVPDWERRIRDSTASGQPQAFSYLVCLLQRLLNLLLAGVDSPDSLLSPAVFSPVAGIWIGPAIFPVAGPELPIERTLLSSVNPPPPFTYRKAQWFPRFSSGAASVGSILCKGFNTVINALDNHRHRRPSLATRYRNASHSRQAGSLGLPRLRRCRWKLWLLAPGCRRPSA